MRGSVTRQASTGSTGLLSVGESAWFSDKRSEHWVESPALSLGSGVLRENLWTVGGLECLPCPLVVRVHECEQPRELRRASRPAPLGVGAHGRRAVEPAPHG